MAVDFVGIQTTDHLNRMFQLSDHKFTVPSAIKRTGHARFRRGPSPSSSDSHGPSTSTQSVPVLLQSTQESIGVFNNKSAMETTSSLSLSSRSTNSSSLLSPLTSGEEGSVSNGKQFSGLGIVAPAPTFSNRKPPLPLSHRKRCRADRPSVSLHGSSSKGCHCCKRRKIASKREIKRVPITGSKITSIPADDYSWKKYGEKLIDGSNYPRVYYKCSTGKGCPARKSVELDKFDTKMLIVTYDGEHNHAPAKILTGLTSSVVQSV
ncbi:WRKY transcription factor WRKY51-like [Rutidosis leptorrhynchoides]|uniref:WRKY transcription factor WRKY51-like n=1 Tax=Rutidosis leptorrhynchoides TaxID=125765 RepID=UPI003A99733C